MNNHQSHIPHIDKNENPQYGVLTPELIRLVSDRVYEMMRRDLIVENERRRPKDNSHSLYTDR